MATVEEKLRSLWNLQSIDKQMDNLRAVRGELPMEVADLEDDIAGLKTRLVNFEHEIEQFESAISGNKERISQAKQLEKKYNEQLNSVKNNREYDALTKEIEIQGLEVLAAEKKIGELQNSIVSKKELIEKLIAHFNSEDFQKVKSLFVKSSVEDEVKLVEDNNKSITTLDNYEIGKS